MGGHGQREGPGAHVGDGLGVGVAGGLGEGEGAGSEVATGFGGLERAGVGAGVVAGSGLAAGTPDGALGDGRAGLGRGTATVAVDESATERRTAHLTRPQ